MYRLLQYIHYCVQVYHEGVGLELKIKNRLVDRRLVERRINYDAKSALADAKISFDYWQATNTVSSTRGNYTRLPLLWLLTVLVACQ